MASKAPQGNASNGYSRQELEALSQQTGTPVEVLWTMGRRDVRQLSERAASAQLEARNTAAAETARREAETKAAGDKAAQEKLAAERPMTERIPGMQEAVSYGSALLPMILPFLTRRYGADQKTIRAWEKAIGEAEKAQGAARAGTGSVADAKVAADRVAKFADDAGKLGKDGLGAWGKDAATVAGTTLASTELPVLPALIDSMTHNPGTRAYDEAAPKLTGQAFLDRVQKSGPITAGLSATGLKIGSLGNRVPPIARSSAVTNQTSPTWADDTAALAKNYGAAAGQQADLSEQLTRELLAQKQLQSWRGAPPAASPALPAPTLPQPSQRALPSPGPQAPPSHGEGGPGLLAGPQGGIAPTVPQMPPQLGLQQPQALAVPGISAPSSPSNSSNPAILPGSGGISNVNSNGTNGVNRNPRPGPWEQTWSDPAREVALEHAAEGGRFGRAGMTGLKMQEAIGEKLPSGVAVPSPSEIGKRHKNLIDNVGPTPTVDELKSFFASDPRRQLFGGAAIGGGIGATTLGSSDEAQADDQTPAKLKIIQALMEHGYRP